jgi:heme/copper-type cytochrome/quinol oxidase subunit 3
MLLMEGTMLVVLLGSYFFLRTGVPDWPPGRTPPPDLFWGTLNTVVILISAFPNHWAKRAAENLDLQRVKLWTIVTFVLALVFAIFRIFEFQHLNTHWMENAYGSIVWFSMGFHTTHVLTDMVDTIVLIALMYLGPIEGRRFVDFQENCIYWNFVVVIWVVTYAVIYIAPRVL